MHSQLIDDIAFDLRIKKYESERIELYNSRVIYSAMSSWMKHILLDHTIEEDKMELKTKNYHYRRSNEILIEFVNLFPEIHNWLYFKNRDPIHIIRDRLISANELVESNLEGDITIAPPQKISITSNTTRLIDLSGEHWKFKYVGVTKIINEESTYKSDHLSKDSLDIVDEFTNRLYYSELLEFNFDYELFNPLKKSNNDKDWLGRGSLKSGINLIRKKTAFENLWDYVLIINDSNKYYQYTLIDELIKQGFHIRIMLGIRKLYKSPIKAKFNIKNQIVVLHLGMKLPKFEQSILTTYSWPRRNIEDNWSFIVPIELWDMMFEMLQTLGFEMEMN